MGDSRSYERALGRSEKATKSFGRVVGGSTQKVTAGFGTFLKGAVIFEGVRAGMHAIGSAARAGASEFSQMQQVAAQTQAVLKSTGGVANVTASDVDVLALRLSRLSGTDDEAIASAENLILTFKNVRNELGQGNRIFDRATLAALDLSKAAGGAFGDLQTTSKQLAKALNDPVRGMTALGRAGVTFTESQRETIKALVETGDILGAQRLILAEVESQVGGSAKAFGQTLPGQLAKVREAFRNVFGNLAAVVAEPLAAALGAIAGFIPRIEAGVSRFAAAVRPIFGNIVAAAREVLPGVLRTVQAVFGPIRQYVEPVIRDVANVIRTTFGNIVQVFDDNRRELTTIFTNLGTVIKSLWTIARPTIVFLFQTVLPTALRIVIPIIEKVTGLYKVMAQVFTVAVSTIVKAISGLLGGFAKMAQAASHLPIVGDQFKGVADKIDAVRAELGIFVADLDALNGKKVNVQIHTEFTSSGVDPADEHGRSRGTPATKDGKTAVRPKTVTPVTQTTKVVETETERTERLRREAEEGREKAEQAAAALKRRNEALREAAKIAQFKELGLTGTGDRLTPGSGSLLNRAQSLQKQIKGTALDSDKTRSQLKRIVSFLKRHFKTAGRDVRQAILGMLNDISSALSGGKGGGASTGPLTKTSGLNTKKILEGMGLSPEEERELRGRLSSLGSGTGLARPGGGARTRGVREGGFGNNPIFVESTTTINLDGNQVARVVTKQQQRGRRRNPQQKRGPHRVGGV